MSVQYVVIAFKTTPLVHKGKTDRIEKSFSMDIQDVLKQFVDKDNMRFSQISKGMACYVVLYNQVAYIAFCDADVQKSAAYNMLIDIRDQFQKRYQMAAIKLASSLQMNREFQGILSTSMQSLKQYDSKLKNLQDEVAETKNIVLDNINAIMKRASKLEEIQDDANELKDNAHEFLLGSDDLKKQMNKKRMCTIIWISVAAVIILGGGIVGLLFGLGVL